MSKAEEVLNIVFRERADKRPEPRSVVDYWTGNIFRDYRETDVKDLPLVSKYIANKHKNTLRYGGGNSGMHQGIQISTDRYHNAVGMSKTIYSEHDKKGRELQRDEKLERLIDPANPMLLTEEASTKHDKDTYEYDFKPYNEQSARPDYSKKREEIFKANAQHVINPFRNGSFYSTLLNNNTWVPLNPPSELRKRKR